MSDKHEKKTENGKHEMNKHELSMSLSGAGEGKTLASSGHGGRRGGATWKKKKKKKLP